MSIQEETNETSSNISSNYQSPINTQSSNTKTKAKSSKLSLANIHPDITFAKILLHILAENKKSKDYYKKINSNQDLHFTVKMRPAISLLDYLRRILKYIKIEFSTLIISMIYIDRICKEKVYLNEFNIHRVMLIAIYMAYTYNEDCIYDNKFLALVSGISKSEMILLEEDFLDLIDFKLFVSEELFDQYKNYFYMDL
jgi:hypothetical protein